MVSFSIVMAIIPTPVSMRIMMAPGELPIDGPGCPIEKVRNSVVNSHWFAMFNIISKVMGFSIGAGGEFK